MPYWKRPSLVIKENRDRAVKELYSAGKISVDKYLAHLKGAPDLGAKKGSKLLTTFELGFVAVIVVSVAYGIKKFS